MCKNNNEISVLLLLSMPNGLSSVSSILALSSISPSFVKMKKRHTSLVSHLQCRHDSTLHTYKSGLGQVSWVCWCVQDSTRLKIENEIKYPFVSSPFCLMSFLFLLQSLLLLFVPNRLLPLLLLLWQ